MDRTQDLFVQNGAKSPAIAKRRCSSFIAATAKKTLKVSLHCKLLRRGLGSSVPSTTHVYTGTFAVNNARDVLVVLKCEQYNCPHCGWRLRLPLSVGDVENLRKRSNKLLHVKVPKKLNGGNITGRSVKDDGRAARSKVGEKRSREMDVGEGEAPQSAAPPQPQPSTIGTMDKSRASEHQNDAIHSVSLKILRENTKVMQSKDLRDSSQAAKSPNEDNPDGKASRSIQVDESPRPSGKAQRSDKPEQHINHVPIIRNASGVAAVVDRSTESQPQATIETRLAAIAQKKTQDNPRVPTAANTRAQAPKQKLDHVMKQNVLERKEASKAVVNVAATAEAAMAEAAPLMNDFNKTRHGAGRGVDHRPVAAWFNFSPQQWMAYMDQLSKQTNASNLSTAIQSQMIHNFNLVAAQNGLQAAWINNLGVYTLPADQARLAFVQQLWRIQNSPAMNDQIRQYALMMLHQMQGQNLNQQTIEGNVQRKVVHHDSQLAMQPQVQVQRKVTQDVNVQVKAVPKSKTAKEVSKVDVSRKIGDVSPHKGSPQNNKPVHTEMQQDAGPAAAEGKTRSDMDVDTSFVEANIGKGKLEVVTVGKDNEELVQQDASPAAAEGKTRSDMDVDTSAVEANIGKGKLEVVTVGKDNEELVQQDASPAAAEGKTRSDMDVDTSFVEANIGKGKLEVVTASKEKASKRLEGIEALSIVLQQAAEDGMNGIDTSDIVDLNGYSIKLCGTPKVVYVNSSTGGKLYLQSVLIDDRLDWDSACGMLQENEDNDGGRPSTEVPATTHQNIHHVSDSVVVLVSQDEDGGKQKGGQTSDSASSEFFIDLTGDSDDEDQTSPAEQPAMPLGNTTSSNAGSNGVQIKSGFYLVEQVARVEEDGKTQKAQRGAILVLRSTSDTGTPAFHLYNPGSRQGHMCDGVHATELLRSSLPVAVDDCEAVWKKQFEEWESNPCSTIHVLHGDFIDNWVALTKAIAMCGALKGDCQAKLRGVSLFATEGPSSNLAGLLVPATAIEEVVSAFLELPHEDTCIYLQD
jgi:hypothetical protein